MILPNRHFIKHLAWRRPGPLSIQWYIGRLVPNVFNYAKDLATRSGQKDEKRRIWLLFPHIPPYSPFPCCKCTLPYQPNYLLSLQYQVNFSQRRPPHSFLSFSLHLCIINSDSLNSSSITCSVTSSCIARKPRAGSANSLLPIKALHKVCHSFQHNC